MTPKVCSRRASPPMPGYYWEGLFLMQEAQTLFCIIQGSNIAWTLWREQGTVIALVTLFFQV